MYAWGAALALWMLMAVFPLTSLGQEVVLSFTFLINVCGKKGGVQGILWPEQMHEASLGVVVWGGREFAAHLSSNLGKQG